MNYFLNRVKVYSLYFYEYLKHSEYAAAVNAVLYMFTRKSFANGKHMTSSMGEFETRRGTLDFQYINYAYEIEIKHFIETHPFEVFFDIGACLGEYCIWLGRKGYPCYAFEPVSESYFMVQKNIQLNKIENKVKAFNYGLGSKHSIEHFKLNLINPGASKRVLEETENTVNFEIKALDDVYEGLGLKKDTKILVKIDVEGMEVEMIRGAKKFFQYFDHITLIIEEKLSGESIIRDALNEICPFEYGTIDNFNIYARKVIN
ncbi:MAG: FkbM family methyltransferase [bacterium]|nr:FkbM family methyltransferase [bacterium]